MKITITVVAILICAAAGADETLSSTYANLVDKSGNISVPENLRRDWAFLGTWSIADEDVATSSAASGHGAAGLHNVYTQRATIDHFRKTGKFPDGAVIVKELLKAVTASMTTGTVSRGTEVEGWFVMVKDTKGRFQSNPLWGDGWGWSLFNADQAEKTVTTNYKTECIGCHIPARKDDWIYLDGYPVLAGEH
ncbi:MAG: cytochrome P460 family protein [Pseudomonadales bacterium]